MIYKNANPRRRSGGGWKNFRQGGAEASGGGLTFQGGAGTPLTALQCSCSLSIQACCFYRNYCCLSKAMMPDATADSYLATVSEVIVKC